MKKSILGFTLCAILFALSFSVQAQQPGKVSHIGYLTGSASLSNNPTWHEAFREGLRERGHIEGKNIIVEMRSNEGKDDRQPPVARDLARLKVDVIVTVGSGDTQAAKDATATIPIVMIQAGDPVGAGFVASLARPGGNITGLSNLRPELSGKRLELLKELVPKLTRVAVLTSSISPDHARVLK